MTPKIRLNNDYSEGCHPLILDELVKTNLESTPGYGSDHYTLKAKALLKEVCDAQDSDVHLFVGGTQTNLTFIASVLRPHQSIVCVDTGHINVHEAGAIEATGHKIETIPHENGKLNAEMIVSFIQTRRLDPTHTHMTQPKLVYISQPTELGTVYTKDELEAIYEVTKSLGLYLYIDGARLGYAIMSKSSDTDLKTYAKVSDAFYLGATKLGALFGEAVIIQHDKLKEDFTYIMKQRGAILAKGRLLGIQFEALFRDHLYLEIAKHANEMALYLRSQLIQLGIKMYNESETNQQFMIMPDKLLAHLDEMTTYEFIEKIDKDHTCIRFCTSWATKKEDLDIIITHIKHYKEKI
jgi:threonine aldolase